MQFIFVKHVLYSSFGNRHTQHYGLVQNSPKHEMVIKITAVERFQFEGCHAEGTFQIISSNFFRPSKSVM